jgi:hypothetical protein
MLHQLLLFPCVAASRTDAVPARRLAEHAGKMVFAEGCLRRQLGQRQRLPRCSSIKASTLRRTKGDNPPVTTGSFH